MIQMLFPFGVDSLILNITHRASEMPEAADLPPLVRAYSWTPNAEPDTQGWIWWIYVQPTDDPALIAEVLAHEASHISDALAIAWGDAASMWGEPKAYFIQAIVHTTTALLKAMCD